MIKGGCGGEIGNLSDMDAEKLSDKNSRLDPAAVKGKRKRTKLPDQSGPQSPKPPTERDREYYYNISAYTGYPLGYLYPLLFDMTKPAEGETFGVFLQM